MPRKSKAKSKGTKEEEIARLLIDGTMPVEVIGRGYARGTVYKVSGEGIVLTAPDNGSSTATFNTPDPTLESDPQIVELRKAVRLAELEKQLARIKALPDLTTRLAKVEQELEDAWFSIDWLIDQI